MCQWLTFIKYRYIDMPYGHNIIALELQKLEYIFFIIVHTNKYVHYELNISYVHNYLKGIII